MRWFRQRESLPTLGEGKRMGCLENLAQLLQQEMAGLMLRSVRLKGKGMTRWAETQPHWPFCAVPRSLNLAKKW